MFSCAALKKTTSNIWIVLKKFLKLTQQSAELCSTMNFVLFEIDRKWLPPHTCMMYFLLSFFPLKKWKEFTELFINFAFHSIWWIYFYVTCILLNAFGNYNKNFKWICVVNALWENIRRWEASKRFIYSSEMRCESI